MKLALIGYPVKHSLSPQLYKEFLGTELTSYDLLPFENPSKIPSLKEFSERYDGLNITSPYKEHFLDEIIVPSPLVREINAVNTLSFTPAGVLGTNTDVVAVEEILENYKKNYSNLHIILLGSGVMARVTELVCEKLSLTLNQVARRTYPRISEMDLNPFRKSSCQNIVINSCSRDFIFKGHLSKDDIFWDYNYSFSSHSSSIPPLVKSYCDGQEMLRLQALSAIKFWKETNPKLKC